jgi:hypothetical protein
VDAARRAACCCRAFAGRMNEQEIDHGKNSDAEVKTRIAVRS